MNRSLGLLLCLSLGTVVGCQSEKLSYANVKGTVTFNGKPISKGMIIFTGEAAGNRPPQVMDIIDGQYAGQAVVGSNKITITAKRKSSKAPAHKLPATAIAQMKGYREYMRDKRSGDEPESDFDFTAEDYIPPEWGSKSKQTRVVEPGGANAFDFHIKGK